MGRYNVLITAPAIPVPELHELASAEATLVAMTAILGSRFDVTGDAARLRPLSMNAALRADGEGIWAGRYGHTLIVAPIDDFDFYDDILRRLPAGLEGLRVCYESVASASYVDLVGEARHRRFGYVGMTGEKDFDEGTELPFEAALRATAEADWNERQAEDEDEEDRTPFDAEPWVHPSAADDFAAETVRWALHREPWSAQPHDALPSMWDLDGYWVPARVRDPEAGPADAGV